MDRGRVQSGVKAARAAGGLDTIRCGQPGRRGTGTDGEAREGEKEEGKGRGGAGEAGEGSMGRWRGKRAGPGVRACVVPMQRWMAVRVGEGVDDFSTLGGHGTAWTRVGSRKAGRVTEGCAN